VPRTELDDDDFPIPPTDLEVAEGEEREEVREALRYLAKREEEATKEAWEPEIAKLQKPLEGSERDEVQAKPHPHAELMRREEDSCFRQFMRLGNFLLKLQTRGAKRAKNEGASGHVDENTRGEETDPMTNCPESGGDAPPPSPWKMAGDEESVKPAAASVPRAAETIPPAVETVPPATGSVTPAAGSVPPVAANVRTAVQEAKPAARAASSAHAGPVSTRQTAPSPRFGSGERSQILRAAR